MINVAMTIREAVGVAKDTDSIDLYERIVQALERAANEAKRIVGCGGVNRVNDGLWDYKIPAIKALRLATGMGLKDAKDWVENFQYDGKTMFTLPLDPDAAENLRTELVACGCEAWVVM